MHHPPLQSRLVADLIPAEFPLPQGILRVRVYANDLNLIVMATCAQHAGDPQEIAKVIECEDPSLCPRMVARWLSARAMRVGIASSEAMAWAEATAAEIMRRLGEPGAGTAG